MKRFIYIFFFLFFTGYTNAQIIELRHVQQSLPFIKDSLLYTDALNRLAFLYYEKNPDSTFFYTQTARNIAERHNYKKGRADALNNLGLGYYLKGNYQLSLRYYNESLDVYKSLQDTSNISQLLMNISLVFFSRDEINTSYKYVREALETGKNLRHDSIMALVSLNYLLLFPDSTGHDSAVKSLTRARAIATKYNDKRILVQSVNVEALLCIRNNEYQKGISLFKEAALQAEKLEILFASMDIYVQLGDILFKKDTAQALYYYEYALGIAKMAGYHEYEKILSKKLYDYYDGTKDINSAKKYANLLIKAHEKEDSLNLSSGINYIDYAIKDKEAESFKAISKARQTTITILSVLSILVLVLLFFMLRSLYSKKRLAKELQEVNKKVTEKNIALQSSDEFNKKIVSILAHDFRQPLANMKSIAGLLKEYHHLSQKDMEEIVLGMENLSDISLEIFENILQWIKRQLSGFYYLPVSLNLKGLFDESVATFTQLTKADNISILNNINEEIMINSDREMIQFINRNLVHNAIKFSPPGAAISINAIQLDDEIVVSVKDEGKGMSAEKIQQLFSFKTEQRYDNDKEKGAGIALMICKDFIEKMNGRIWASSEQAKGTTFLYALPLVK